MFRACGFIATSIEFFFDRMGASNARIVVSALPAVLL